MTKTKFAKYVRVTEEFKKDMLLLSLVIPKAKELFEAAWREHKAIISPIFRRDGYSGDDFTMCMYTYMAYCYAVKAPRFANPYRKEHRKNKINKNK